MYYVETGKAFVIENVDFDGSFKGIMQLAHSLVTWAQFSLWEALSCWTNTASDDA